MPPCQFNLPPGESVVDGEAGLTAACARYDDQDVLQVWSVSTLPRRLDSGAVLPAGQVYPGRSELRPSCEP